MSTKDDLKELRKKLVARKSGKGDAPAASTPAGKRATTVPRLPSESLGSTIRLEADDLELLEEQAGPPPTPVPPAAAPPAVAQAPAQPAPDPSRVWEEDAAFYRREAAALVPHHPERASVMWLHAAKAALAAGQEPAAVAGQVEAALQQAPNSPQLVALLRRLMHDLQLFDRVLELTERQLQLGGDAASRIAGLLEAAAIARHLKGDAAAALSYLHRALDLHPGHPVALTMTATLHLEMEQAEDAALCFEQLADVLPSPAGRAACLFAAGTLRELRLAQPGRAELDYGRAVEADHEHLAALVALSDLHESVGSWQHLCQDLEQIAALEQDATLRARHLLRVGLLHLYRTKDLEAAARAFAAAADAAPSDAAPLTRLVEVYELTGRREKLVESLRQLLALTLDAPGQAALLVRIGWLLRHWADKQEEVITAYCQALAVQPGYLPAVQALGTIYRQRGDFAGLVSILQSESEGTDAVSRRAACFLEIAEILAERMQRPAEAIEAYQRALDLAPDLRLAFWRLRAFLYREGRHSELARLLATQVESTVDEGVRHYLLLELARLQAGPLHAGARAIASLEQARRLSGHRIAELELLELYGQTGHFAEMVQLLLEQAASTPDAAEAKWRRMQAALMMEDPLAEHDRALEVYWQVLADDPHCVSAIRAAGRILHRLGRWHELIELHRRELESVSDPVRRAEIWCRIGRVFESDLGHPSEAIGAFQKALELEPGYTMALDALERLLSYEQRYSELVGVLQHYATRRKEAFASADLLCRAAEVADALLDDPARSVALYEQALQRTPGAEVPLSGLLRLQLRLGAFAQAGQNLEALLYSAKGATDRGRLLLQLARLKEYRLDGHPDPAFYDAAAAQCPAYGSRLLLEQLRCRRLVPDVQLDAALFDLGALLPDPVLSATYLIECAQRAEWQALREQQIEAARQALARRPDELAASWCLQRAMAATGQRLRLAELVEGEAAQQSDPMLQLHLLADAAIAHLCSGETEREVIRLAHECLSRDPHFLPALRWLLRPARQSPAELAPTYDQLAEACADPDNRLQAALAAADLWEKIGDAQRALESLNRLLLKDPTQPEIFARTERLLQARGDSAGLAQLYAQQIAASTDPRRRVELMRRHVRLLREGLNDVPRAIAELQRLLETAPDDRDALAELAELLRATQRWSDAINALAQLAERSEEPTQRQAARLAQARILLHELHQPQQALQVLQQALAEEPGNLEAKQVQVELFVAECQWDDAQKLLDEVSAENQPALQVWALAQLSEVARVGRRDEALRERYEREALTLAAVHPAVLDAHVERYRRRRDLAHFAQVGTKALAELTNADAVARLRVMLARLLLEDLKQAATALDYLREARVAEPQSLEISLLYHKALEHEGEVEAAAAGYRALLETDPKCVEAYRGLSRLMGLLGKPALAAAAVSLLDMLGAATAAERGQAEGLEHRGSPPGRLELRFLPLAQELKVIDEAFCLALPHLGGLFPLELQRPLPLGHPAAVVAGQIARALGLAGARVGIEGDDPARAGVGNLPALQISARLAADPPSAPFAFWVGRALAGATTAGSVLERLSDSELGQLIEALVVDRPIAAAVQRLRKRITSLLPRKSRKQVEALKPTQVRPKTWTVYREAERLRADQIGLLVCGSPKIALSELAGMHGPKEESRILDLMRFAMSDSYAAAHNALWTLVLQSV